MDQPMEGITVVEVKDKIDHMTYLPGMEQIDPTVRLQVTAARDGYDETIYTAKDVRAALDADVRTPEHFAALLSPAAEPFLEEMAQKARMEKRRYFGDNVYLTSATTCTSLLPSTSPTTVRTTASTVALTVTTRSAGPSWTWWALRRKWPPLPKPALRRF